MQFNFAQDNEWGMVVMVGVGGCYPDESTMMKQCFHIECIAQVSLDVARLCYAGTGVRACCESSVLCSGWNGTGMHPCCVLALPMVPCGSGSCPKGRPKCFKVLAARPHVERCFLMVRVFTEKVIIKKI